ncbi:odorant receptor 33b-like [Teleopsis dalmanni]|uniref:odorant receptor 33b-like n=1 Tax=Teleopsis dalmanni TaxID=139649 RepID=UPI0018CCD3FE|nr:odorant receptor 33b-like [Teleopsis dalmanni]
MTEIIDSNAVFERYYIFWKILGFSTKYNKYLMFIYQIIVTGSITFGFPLHLNIGLVLTKSQEELFNNLVINVASTACSIKFFFLLRDLKNMHKVNHLLSKLDVRVVAEDERAYFHQKVNGHANKMVTMFSTAYFSVGFLSIASLFLDKNRRLVYPAWFPFDWKSTTQTYVGAVLFQFFGLYVQIVQNFVNDVYGPIAFCMFAGHVHLLGMRVSKIGHNENTNALVHLSDLHDCVEDYNYLMSIYTTLQKVVSKPLFVQFFAGAVNICVAVVYLIFYANSIITYVYYTMHLFSICVELFPVCYYGSLMEQEFRDLPYAIFSCKWFTQPQKFRRSVIIFTQLSLRNVTALAGGMVRIHLDSFFVTCKMAYSFFTAIMSMK